MSQKLHVLPELEQMHPQVEIKRIVWLILQQLELESTGDSALLMLLAALIWTPGLVLPMQDDEDGSCTLHEQVSD